MSAVFQMPRGADENVVESASRHGNFSPKKKNDFFDKFSAVGLITRRPGRTTRLDVRTTCRIFNDNDY